jgi:hypothetical protein
MNSVFKSMYILLLVVILVFHAALPLLSLNPKPAVKAAVPAQTQLPSTNDAFSYDALSFRLFISVGSLRLRRRPKEWVVVSQVAEDVSIVSPDEANVESPTTTKIKRSELQTKLNAGDEVTTSTGSYGRVRSQEGSVVQVEIDGDVRQCARNTIHLRHWVTKAFFGLTNDRKQYARAKRTCLHVS